MKKVLVILLVSAFVSAFAFADGIAFGAWGRVGYIFAQGVSDPQSSANVTVGTFPSWANGARVGLGVSGSSANIGFNLNIDSNNGVIGAGDEAKVWVKFIDQLKVELGKVQVNALRGKVGGSGTLDIYTAGDEDAIFQRFYPKAGFALEITPVEGLFIAAALDSTNKDPDGKTTFAAALDGIQVGAGYTIKDIGQVRVQYIGAGMGLDDKKKINYSTTVLDAETGLKATPDVYHTVQAKYLQAAFALTAVKDLTIDLGTKFNLDSRVAVRTPIVLGASFNSGALSLMLRSEMQLGTNMGFGAYLMGAYKVADPMSIGLEVAYDANVSDKTNKDDAKLTFMPSVKFGYGQGEAVIGFNYTVDMPAAGTAQNTWSIPIGITYWF